MQKSDFPIFQHYPEIVYLDSAATTQKPQVVLETISRIYNQEYATVHRALYPLAVQISEKYEKVREITARFLNTPSAREIVFTHGATEGLNLLAYSLSQNLQPGDEVIISELEHHANLVPWQQVAGVKLIYAPINENGEIDQEELYTRITKRTRIISLSLCSNVLGTIFDFPALRKKLDEQGSDALLIADAAQAAPHFSLNVQTLGIDFLVFSGHKIYGPSGTGVLWGRGSLLAKLPPYQTGGDMIKTVSVTGAQWNDVPWKFEAGTPNIEGIIALGAALTYVMEIGMDTIQAHTEKLTSYALETLTSVKRVNTPTLKSGIISFTVPDIHPHDVAEMLGEQQVCIRAGHHCAAPLHEKLQLPATNRISLGIYNTEEDINRFADALNRVITFFSHV